jgi:hypothetical protein
MDKTKDILFMQSIEKYDLVFLAETHVGYDSGIKHIGQFLYHSITLALNTMTLTPHIFLIKIF